MYLFDDIFASSDQGVAQRLFRDLVEGYLVQQRGATVIMVINQHRLIDLDAHNVILLSEKGATTDKGLIKQYLSEHPDAEPLNEEETDDRSEFSHTSSVESDHSLESLRERSHSRISEALLECDSSSDLRNELRGEQDLHEMRQELGNPPRDINLLSTAAYYIRSLGVSLFIWLVAFNFLMQLCRSFIGTFSAHSPNSSANIFKPRPSRGGRLSPLGYCP